jgi:predicted phage terminase large subunit-like protein
VPNVLEQLRDPEVLKYLEALDEPHLEAFRWRARWLQAAHDHQIVPAGDWWTIWLMLAGRGAGKTRAAAEAIASWAWEQPRTRWLVAAPTSGDVRGTCFEGDSGLMSVIPEKLIDDYNKSLHELRLVNGSFIKGIPASEPERFRGPQFHGGWLDELAAWDYLDSAWDMIQFGMRLGARARIIASTTPKPKPKILELLAREGEDVAVTRASTYVNVGNLADNFKRQILQYEGTNLGRQEIHAEIIDPEEAGIVKRAWFRLWPADRALPRFDYVVQSYDCATSEKTQNDPTACTVWGVFRPNDDAPMSVMLIDCWSEHMQYPDLRPRVVDEYDSVYGDPDEFGNGRRVDIVLIEDKSAGISLIQDLQRAGLPVRGYNPGKADKMMRLNIVAPLVERGRVYLPESEVIKGEPRDWVQPFLNQVCAFPEVRNDDYVDTMTQVLRFLRDAGFINIDPLPDDEFDEDERQPRVNPYAQ